MDCERHSLFGAKKYLYSYPTPDFHLQPKFKRFSQPLHVLVAGRGNMRNNRGVVCHLGSVELPQKSIVADENGFIACSFELCFVQVASILSIIELIELGFEMCGSYGISRGEYCKCKPLTSVENLKAFVERVEGMHGAKKARRALQYVLNNSASPMETKLAMLLSLPYSMGGYGIAAPLLNYRIDFDRNARKISRKKYCECDLYWPKKKLSVEYDGEEFHTGMENISKDSSRRDALTSMGVSMVTITRWQINNSGEFNGIAKAIAKRLGKQLRYKDPKFTRNHLDLRKVLLRTGSSC